MNFKSFANKGFATGAFNKLVAKHSPANPGEIYMGDVDGNMKWGFDVDENGIPCKAPEPVVEAVPVQTLADKMEAAASNPFGGMASALTRDRAPAAQSKRDNVSGYKIEKDRPEQNGIRKPSEGTTCRQIWDELDTLSADLPTTETVPVKQWKIRAEEMGIDPTTATIQFYRWRNFNGVTGRQK